MKGRSVGAGARCELIQRGIDDALTGGVQLLIDECQHTGEDRSGEASAAGDRQVGVVAVTKTVGAASTHSCRIGIARTEEITCIFWRRVE